MAFSASAYCNYDLIVNFKKEKYNSFKMKFSILVPAETHTLVCALITFKREGQKVPSNNIVLAN